MLRRFGVTVLLPGVVLLLFGLRALEQDRRRVDRQIHDRMENAAALAAGAIDQQLANWQQFRADGILLAGNPVKLTPEERSAYEVGEEPAVEAPAPSLGEAEQQEFRGDLGKAIGLYLHAAENPQIRAQALVRLGETYTKAGKRELAAEAYHDVLRLPEDRISRRTVELVARFELCEMGRGNRPAFYHDLVAGRWRLDKARYLFYSEASREWTPESDPARTLEREKLATSAAIENYLQIRRRLLGDFVAFWDEGTALLLPAAKLRERLEQSVALDRELKIRLADAGAERPSLSGTHVLSDRDLPWMVESAPLDPVRLYAEGNQRREVYLAMLLLVFLVLAFGSYMTARAVNREIEVARLKSEFVATVSHEFRSPLTAIRQLSELLKRGRVEDEEKRQQYYALISRESGRLSRLVENLLDFSRLEEGRKQFHFERVESGEWLRDLASSFGGGTLSLSVPEELPAIQGDRMALTSAVENLLDNAVKYSPPGSPVALEAEASAAQLTIRVRDQGYGIAEEDRGHVFERFYRGNGEISRRVKGAGVGLSLVRQIVEAHGGHVDFDTRLGKGSEFRIRLKTV
jgi:signal transduction histidine kinase